MSRKVLIVGGVAGGAGTAARLRRMDESAQIIMFEKGLYLICKLWFTLLYWWYNQ